AAASAVGRRLEAMPCGMPWPSCFGGTMVSAKPLHVSSGAHLLLLLRILPLPLVRLVLPLRRRADRPPPAHHDPCCCPLLSRHTCMHMIETEKRRKKKEGRPHTKIPGGER